MKRNKLIGWWVISLLILISPSLLFAQLPGSTERGKRYYDGHCASCHGLTGDGNGPQGNGLNTRPTNFKNSSVMSALKNNDLERVILTGKENTAMRGYATVLQPQDVKDLTTYLRSFSK